MSGSIIGGLNQLHNSFHRATAPPQGQALVFHAELTASRASGYSHSCSQKSTPAGTVVPLCKHT